MHYFKREYSVFTLTEHDFTLFSSIFPTQFIRKGSLLVNYGGQDIRGMTKKEFFAFIPQVTQVNKWNSFDILTYPFQRQYLDPTELVSL